ncbi:MAG: hypothetical protein OHK0015_39820 [Chloroflexi bacterium OHK40]
MASFELIDPAGGPAPPGPWASRPIPAGSFGAAGESEAALPLWRVILPASPVAARADLAAAEHSLAAQEAAVAAAPIRLRALATGGSAVSFGAPTATPETNLLALIAEQRGVGAASFGGGGGPLAEAEERFGAFVAQVRDAIAYAALVETLREGVLVARSQVGWTGDLRSLLAPGPLGEHRALHRRALALALRSRAALLRSFGIVMRGAAIVAAMASSPAGALIAAPAAWRFVDDLLREVRG